MIVKITNKDEMFYHYMGKFFGSRIVQTETNDRIYDDNRKTWYVYMDLEHKPLGFISVCDNTIKNIYSSNAKYLKELILEVMKDMTISDSVVTNTYIDIYKECGLQICSSNLKNFVKIRGEQNVEN